MKTKVTFTPEVGDHIRTNNGRTFIILDIHHDIATTLDFYVNIEQLTWNTLQEFWTIYNEAENCKV